MDGRHSSSPAAGQVANAREWKFSDLIADPVVRERWERVRRYFFLRESTYDMTRRCNIRCEGCYYFEGDKQHAAEVRDPKAWRALMQAERERGITYVVLAGAEPSLVPELLAVCFDEMPLGAIATNGLQRIPESVGYRIHISVWGNDDTSLRIRRAKDMLARQIANYHGDPRAVFVYTFTPHNIVEAGQVAETLARQGCRLTFNMFSAPVGYTGTLRHTPQSLTRTRRAMLDLLARYPQNVIFSAYNAVAHTHLTGAARSVRLLLSSLQPFDGHRPGTLVPPVPHRSELGPGGGLLRTRYRLPRLPPLCGR